ALAATIARYGDRMKPGDVYCLNDPFEGGMHIPDVFVLKPIFFEGERLAFAATICHQTDMGGRVAGSNASDSTEIYQEGLRIPPVKMYDQGEPNETLFRLFEKNVRVPVKVFGDLRAQLAACHIAEEAFLRLIHRHGALQVIAPPGTIANGVLPAASAARGLTGFRMIDTCFGALARMLPHRSIAASEGGNTGISIGGYDPDRKPFIFVEFICSAWGGRAWSDGLDGNANLMANMSLPPVEVTEAEQPLQILCTEFIQDVGGPGKY